MKIFFLVIFSLLLFCPSGFCSEAQDSFLEEQKYEILYFLSKYGKKGVHASSFAKLFKKRTGQNLVMGPVKNKRKIRLKEYLMSIDGVEFYMPNTASTAISFRLNATIRGFFNQRNISKEGAHIGPKQRRKKKRKKPIVSQELGVYSSNFPEAYPYWESNYGAYQHSYEIYNPSREFQESPWACLVEDSPFQETVAVGIKKNQGNSSALSEVQSDPKPQEEEQLYNRMIALSFRKSSNFNDFHIIERAAIWFIEIYLKPWLDSKEAEDLFCLFDGSYALRIHELYKNHKRKKLIYTPPDIDFLFVKNPGVEEADIEEKKVSLFRICLRAQAESRLPHSPYFLESITTNHGIKISIRVGQELIPILDFCFSESEENQAVAQIVQLKKERYIQRNFHILGKILPAKIQYERVETRVLQFLNPESHIYKRYWHKYKSWSTQYYHFAWLLWDELSVQEKKKFLDNYESLLLLHHSERSEASPSLQK